MAVKIHIAPPRSGLRHAADELFPSVCQTEVAKAHDEGWHIDESDNYCHRCGATAGPGGMTHAGCAFCVGKPIVWDRFVRLAAYKAPARDWVVAMKFARQWSWAQWFGCELAQAIGSDGADRPTVVCPVPMHWTRRLWRGYNQASLIAQALAKQRNWQVLNLLTRTRYTRPQTGVPPSRRQANIRRSFTAKRVDLTGWRVWLVDDVKTSGATLTACARLLRRAGAGDIRVAVATVADPKGADFKTK